MDLEKKNEDTFWSLTEHKLMIEIDRLRHTLSSEQDLLGVARQPQPRWSLSVRKHLYPVHELLTPATHQTISTRSSENRNCLLMNCGSLV